jgi:putative holliday junction resolvase
MKDDPDGSGREEEGGGRTLALDLGDRRIGIALSDPMGLTASPLMTLQRTTWQRDLDTIRSLAREHEVRRIVVGLPLAMDGGRGGRVRVTEVFMERIKGATGLPVVPWDERLSTVQVIDQVAAMIVLQAYLDAQRSAGERR